MVGDIGITFVIDFEKSIEMVRNFHYRGIGVLWQRKADNQPGHPGILRNQPSGQVGGAKRGVLNGLQFGVAQVTGVFDQWLDD